MKKETISIKLSAKDTKIFFKKIQEKIGPTLARQLKRYADKEIKTIHAHMKKDKWDLRYNLIEEGIVQEILGPIDWYLISRLLNEGFRVKCKKDRLTYSWFVTHESKKTPKN